MAPPPVRWSMMLGYPGDGELRGGRQLTLGEGESVTFGGDAGPLAGGAPLARLSVSPLGDLEVERLGAPKTVLLPGQRLGLGESWLELIVPPSLESGRAAPTLTRWALAFELHGRDRTQPFRFTRATGERFSHGRHDQNVLRFPSDRLARRHTELFVDARGQLWAHDAQSPGGTWLLPAKVRLEGWTLVTPDAELLTGGEVHTRLVEPPRAEAR